MMAMPMMAGTPWWWWVWRIGACATQKIDMVSPDLAMSFGEEMAGKGTSKANKSKSQKPRAKSQEPKSKMNELITMRSEIGAAILLTIAIPTLA